jgi:hypothetical protein
LYKQVAESGHRFGKRKRNAKAGPKLFRQPGDQQHTIPFSAANYFHRSDNWAGEQNDADLPGQWEAKLNLGQ